MKGSKTDQVDGDEINTVVDTPDGVMMLLANQNNLSDRCGVEPRWTKQQQEYYARTKRTPPAQEELDDSSSSGSEEGFPSEWSRQQQAEDGVPGGYGYANQAENLDAVDAEDDLYNQADNSQISHVSRSSHHSKKKHHHKSKHNHRHHRHSKSVKDSNNAVDEDEDINAIRQELQEKMSLERQDRRKHFFDELKNVRRRSLIEQIVAAKKDITAERMEKFSTPELELLLQEIGCGANVEAYRDKKIKQVVTVVGTASRLLSYTGYNLLEGTDSTMAYTLKSAEHKADWEHLYFEKQNRHGHEPGSRNLWWSMFYDVGSTVGLNAVDKIGPVIKRWTGNTGDDPVTPKDDVYVPKSSAAPTQQPASATASASASAPSQPTGDAIPRTFVGTGVPHSQSQVPAVTSGGGDMYDDDYQTYVLPDENFVEKTLTELEKNNPHANTAVLSPLTTTSTATGSNSGIRIKPVAIGSRPVSASLSRPLSRTTLSSPSSAAFSSALADQQQKLKQQQQSSPVFSDSGFRVRPMSTSRSLTTTPIKFDTSS